MGFVAGTISAAIANTNSRVGLSSQAGLLKQNLVTFNSLWKPLFSKDSTRERTVRNWFPCSLALQKDTPATGNSQERQDVVDVVCRVLYATEAAFAGSRIKQSQRDSVIGAWNNSFGANP